MSAKLLTVKRGGKRQSLTKIHAQISQHLNPYTNPRHYSVDIFLGVNEPRPQICICEFMCINEP